MLEGDLHPWLMLGDYLHTAFLADFVVVYFRSLAANGLAWGSEMHLSGSPMAERV